MTTFRSVPSVCLFELREELPSIVCCECLRSSFVHWLGGVVSVKGNPSNGVFGRTATIHGLDMCPTPLGRLRSVLHSTSVILKESVAHLATSGDGQNRVVNSVLCIVGYRVGTGAGASTTDLWIS